VLHLPVKSSQDKQFWPQDKQWLELEYVPLVHVQLPVLLLVQLLVLLLVLLFVLLFVLFGSHR
jgi:hypothetical protein